MSWEQMKHSLIDLVINTGWMDEETDTCLNAIFNQF